MSCICRCCCDDVVGANNIISAGDNLLSFVLIIAAINGFVVATVNVAVRIIAIGFVVSDDIIAGVVIDHVVVDVNNVVPVVFTAAVVVLDVVLAFKQFYYRVYLSRFFIKKSHKRVAHRARRRRRRRRTRDEHASSRARGALLVFFRPLEEE